MEKAMPIIDLIAITTFFLCLGIFGTFFPDKTWEILVRMRRAMGDGTEYKQTQTWESSTRAVGILFLVFAILVLTDSVV